MGPYLNKEYNLYVDNWYTSPQLFSVLHENKINDCGTVELNRKYKPSLKGKLKKGEKQYSCTDKILSLKWHNKRDITMLTTFHNKEIETVDNKSAKK